MPQGFQPYSVWDCSCKFKWEFATLIVGFASVLRRQLRGLTGLVANTLNWQVFRMAMRIRLGGLGWWTVLNDPKIWFFDGFSVSHKDAPTRCLQKFLVYLSIISIMLNNWWWIGLNALHIGDVFLWLVCVLNDGDTIPTTEFPWGFENADDIVIQMCSIHNTHIDSLIGSLCNQTIAKSHLYVPLYHLFLLPLQRPILDVDV